MGLLRLQNVSKTSVDWRGLARQAETELKLQRTDCSLKRRKGVRRRMVIGASILSSNLFSRSLKPRRPLGFFVSTLFL